MVVDTQNVSDLRYVSLENLQWLLKASSLTGTEASIINLPPSTYSLISHYSTLLSELQPYIPSSLPFFFFNLSKCQWFSFICSPTANEFILSFHYQPEDSLSHLHYTVTECESILSHYIWKATQFDIMIMDYGFFGIFNLFCLAFLDHKIETTVVHTS